MRWLARRQQGIVFGSLLCVLGSFGCKDGKPTAGAPEPASTVTPSAVEQSDLPLPPPPPPDFEFARRFSPLVYPEFADRIIPYKKMAREAFGAFKETKLKAVERDFFVDDWLYRKGGLVLLGTEKGRIVALTTRFYADIRYPDVKLIKDGWGTAEVGSQFLVVNTTGVDCYSGARCSNPTYRLRRHGSKRRENPRFAAEPVVEYRVFDDHDVALLYFSKDDIPFRESDTLGIRNPTRAIRRKLQRASSLYGFEMVVMSKQSLAEMRRHIKVESAAGPMLKMAVSLVASPLVGAIAGQVSGLSEELIDKATRTATNMVSKEVGKLLEPLLVPMVDSLEYNGRRRSHGSAERLLVHAPTSMPTVVANGRVEISGGDRLTVESDGTLKSIADLLGVRIDGKAREELERYLEQALSPGQVIISSEDWGIKAGSVVLLPEGNIVLNVELLRHGFAKLDLRDSEVLRSFPELVDAAWQAVENRTGLARDWGDDEEYVAAVDALR